MYSLAPLLILVAAAAAHHHDASLKIPAPEMRQRIKNQLVDQLISSGSHSKRAAAEMEVEETLQMIQLAKKAANKMMGSDAEPRDDGLWQGDILLNKEQAELLIVQNGGTLPQSRRSKRSILFPDGGFLASGSRWEWPISYLLDSSLDQKAKDIVKACLAKITESLPCLKFAELTAPPTDTEKVYMKFVKTDMGGCGGYAPIGKNAPKFGNAVSIDTSMGWCKGCPATMMVTHEIFHSLGLHHEQCRGDRDSFININFDNIEQGMAGQFSINKNATYTPYGQPYSFESVMHYHSTAFGINGKQVMSAKNDPTGAKTKLMGSACGAYLTDIIQLNRTYCQNPSGPIPSHTTYMMSTGKNCLDKSCPAAEAPKDPNDCPAGFKSVMTGAACFECGSSCRTALPTDDWVIQYYRTYLNMTVGTRLCADDKPFRSIKLRKCVNTTPGCADEGPHCGWKPLETTNQCKDSTVAAACPKSCGTSLCDKAYA